MRLLLVWRQWKKIIIDIVEGRLSLWKLLSILLKYPSSIMVEIRNHRESRHLSILLLLFSWKSGGRNSYCSQQKDTKVFWEKNGRCHRESRHLSILLLLFSWKSGGRNSYCSQQKDTKVFWEKNGRWGLMIDNKSSFFFTFFFLNS